MGLGSFLNSITGASSAAAQSQKYALEQMAQSNAYQKEFAQNAHQWEIQDLKKAGLNPILSAGGSGAVASGGQTGSGASNQAPISPLDFINTIASAKQMMSQSSLNEANQLKTLTENGLLPQSTAANIAKAEADAYFQTHRALGFSESESHSESDQSGWNLDLGGGAKVGEKFGGGIGGNGKIGGGRTSAKSTSHQKARTW